MHSGVLLFVCSDLPQRRDGQGKQLVQRFPRFPRSADSRHVARIVAICREFGAKQAKCGELLRCDSPDLASLCRHLAHVGWADSPNLASRTPIAR